MHKRDGRKQSHNLKEHWDSEKIKGLTDLLYELGLNRNLDTNVDALYEGKVRVKDNDLIILPPTQYNRISENKKDSGIVAGILEFFFGGGLGCITGMLTYVVYSDLTQQHQPEELIVPAIVGGAIGTIALGTFLYKIFTNNESPYLTINPFSKVAEEIGNRADYVSKELKYK